MQSKPKLPPFDPRQAPIVSAGVPVAFAAHGFSVAHIRERFIQRSTLGANRLPAFEPERLGDSIRIEQANPTPSAVLIAIVDHPEPTMLLTQRTTKLTDHSGQVAFPGGRKDVEDASLVATALREAQEEVGLASERCEVLGQLPDYFTGTGYQVTPVVAIVSPGFSLNIQPDEVDAVFEVPLAFLMDPANHQRREMQWQGRTRDFYAMPYTASRWWADAGQNTNPREFFIWGATAAMLRNLYRFVL